MYVLSNISTIYNMTLKEEKRKMPKDGKGQGVTPPILGKFTGRLRTPVSIFAGFFVLGIMADLLMNLVANNVDAMRQRVHVGFRFWQFHDGWDCKLPDGNTVDGRETIAWDDIILLIITFALLFIYKIRLMLRCIASGGFFLGWYCSSMWFAPMIPWDQFNSGNSNDSSSNSATKGF